MIKQLIATGALLAGLALPQKVLAHDITLSYDYFQNKKNTALIQHTTSAEGTLSEKAITSTADYFDHIATINRTSLTNAERIQHVGILGDTAGINYDYSYPFKKVSLDTVFRGIQQATQTGTPSEGGAICGGIHNFTRKASQHLGFPAINYSGRNGTEGAGHFFTSILGDEGFVHQNYGQLVHTRTFNFYQALVLAQRAEGSVEFNHLMYDGRFLFRTFTPDAQRIFRFAQFDPTLDAMIKTLDPRTSHNSGGHIVLGNTELSGAYEHAIDLSGQGRYGILTLTGKAGRMYGQPPSTLKHADIFEGKGTITIDVDYFFIDMTFGAFYGILQQYEKQEQRPFFFGDTILGGRATLDKQTRLVYGIRFASIGDIPKVERDGINSLLALFDLNTITALQHGPITAYTAVQLIQAPNNVEEQQFAVHLGDIETGILYTCPFGRTRIAGRLKPEAYEARIGLEHKHFSLKATYGIGRHDVFTPDYVEAETTGRLPLTELTGNKDSKNILDRTSIEGKLSIRHELWSHKETNTSGSAQAVLMVEF